MRIGICGIVIPIIEYHWKRCARVHDREYIIEKIVTRAASFLKLPDSLQFHFEPMKPEVWGGVDLKNYTKIGLNSSLSLSGIPIIVLHELIHVEQRHLGHLSISKDGWYSWHNIKFTNQLPENMDENQYKNLPWELDVVERLPNLIKNALII